MPTFVLHRATALTEEEWTRLPRGAEAVNDGTDMVARAEVDGPLLDLLVFTAALARAVPDGRLLIRLSAAIADVAAGAAATTALQTVQQDAGAEPPPVLEVVEAADDPALKREDPWALLDRGDLARAERRFAMGYELDMTGRDRVRELFNSTDPATSALGARLAGYTNWKSFVTTLRRAVDHADVRVRRDVVIAIGKLAGPAMVPALEDRLRDPSPEVQAAARDAIARIRTREPPPIVRRR